MARVAEPLGMALRVTITCELVCVAVRTDAPTLGTVAPLSLRCAGGGGMTGTPFWNWMANSMSMLAELIWTSEFGPNVMGRLGRTSAKLTY